MTYEQIIETLKSNHFYPDTVTKNGKITELHVQAPPVLMEDKKKRLQEILEGDRVKISGDTNKGYIVIKTKTK